MTKIKYFIQFILIIILFGLFKILGIKNSSKLSEFLFVLCGPIFRSKKIFEKNIIKIFPIMENIRKKYICRKQIKKGISGTKQILKEYKNGTSIALMIDQRVSEGIKANFFNHKALTTTIPAQFVKKFKTKIIPIYIERLENNKFKIEVFDPREFNSNESVEMITNKLNKILEDLIKRNPNQWIWTHDRWK
jgi:KDO2-lipid IV(A) lauroyltransferase